MDSRRKKKKKSIKNFNKQIKEKCYNVLPPGKKLLRFLKETESFMPFVRLVMIKHKKKFNDAVNLIKMNPDIFYLVGESNFSFFCTLLNESIAVKYYERFQKFRPPC